MRNGQLLRTKRVQQMCGGSATSMCGTLFQERKARNALFEHRCELFGSPRDKASISPGKPLRLSSAKPFAVTAHPPPNLVGTVTHPETEITAWLVYKKLTCRSNQIRTHPSVSSRSLMKHFNTECARVPPSTRELRPSSGDRTPNPSTIVMRRGSSPCRSQWNPLH